MIVAHPEKNQELIEILCEIWLDYMKATHPFLNEWHISNLLGYIKEKILVAEHLLVMYDESSAARGFVVVEDKKIEVLALRAICRGKGYDAFLVDLATDDFGVNEVDVYEKNTAGKEFYESLGYKQIRRSETDIANNPKPILHLQYTRKSERINPLSGIDDFDL